MKKWIKLTAAFIGTFAAGVLAGAVYMAMFTDSQDDMYDGGDEDCGCACGNCSNDDIAVDVDVEGAEEVTVDTEVTVEEDPIDPNVYSSEA